MHFGNQHRDLVQEAPAPILAGLQRADQRVAAASSVGARVAVGRVVAAADLAALEADSQMQPWASRGQAILAARDGFRELGDVNVIEMCAGGHLIEPLMDNPSIVRNRVSMGYQTDASDGVFTRWARFASASG